MKPDVLDALIDNGYKGIVWDGTGLGHVNKGMFDAIQRATDAGIHQYIECSDHLGLHPHVCI
jgi:L-asparaginase/archaeal Glu-tRNAGln amidotransferase subunit D